MRGVHLRLYRQSRVGPLHLDGLPFPAHFRRRLPGHATFTALEVLHSRPSTDRASLATSLSLIGLLTPVPPGDPASPPEVTRCSSVPCHACVRKRIRKHLGAVGE